MRPEPFKYISSALLALAALAVFSAWAYMSFESFSLRDEAQAVRGEIESEAGKDSYLMSVRNVLRGAESDISAVESLFIIEDEVPEYVGFLEGEIARFGLKGDISSISLNPLAKGASWRELRVRVLATGAWKDLVALLDSLDAGDEAARVDRASLSKSGEGAGGTAGGWALSVELTRYVK